MSSEPFDPIADREAAAALGESLRAVGYNEQGIIGLLGTKRYTYETAKGVIRRAGFDFYLARSIDLAEVVDV